MTIASRSPIVRLGIRMATPIALVVGTYLLFAGHNNPGGGFAAGLVFGAVVTLRVISGIQEPDHSGLLIAGGTILVAFVAVMPLFWGDSLLDQKVIEFELPLLGKIKTGSALPFDIGVTAIVVGLVLALLAGLSATALDSEPAAPRSTEVEA